MDQALSPHRWAQRNNPCHTGIRTLQGVNSGQEQAGLALGNETGPRALRRGRYWRTGMESMMAPAR